MKGRKREARPHDREVQRWVALTLHFLDHFHAAAARALSAAKVGWETTHEDKYLGEMAYHTNCMSAILWLANHAPAWGARNAWEEPTDGGQSV